MVYSALRYTLQRLLREFLRLPRVSRFFLSISLTLCLAVFTLRVIFYFSPPDGVSASRSSSQQRSKGAEGAEGSKGSKGFQQSKGAFGSQQSKRFAQSRRRKVKSQ